MQVRKMVTFLYVLLASTAMTAVAFAEGTGAPEGEGKQWIQYLAAAIAIGSAAFGGAIGQGRTAAAALEGIARNPNASGKVFTPMILGLALIESLVIYALIISFLCLG